MYNHLSLASAFPHLCSKKGVTDKWH